MGINLIPYIPSDLNRGGPYIERAEFIKKLSEHDFAQGCIESEGLHRLLRFDFYCINIGNDDFVVGNPATQPEIFFPDPTHEHYHAKDFNKYHLLTESGKKIDSKKQAFCMVDFDRWLPTASLERRFRDCDTMQGISAGWADIYRADMQCQYIVLEGPGIDRVIEDGVYTLIAETNALREDGSRKGRRNFEVEDNYEDNIFVMHLEIKGDNVTVVETNRSVDIPVQQI